MGGAHDLLGHHEVVGLGAVYSFLTLNGSHAELRVLQATTAHLSNGTYPAYPSGHLCTLTSELLDCPRSIRAVFSGHFWAVALQSDHAGADSNNRIVANLPLAVRKVLIAAASHAALVSLICESSAHHGLLGRAVTDHLMAHMTAHPIILDHRDSAGARKM